jgi:predicted ABC-type ATPase
MELKRVDITKSMFYDDWFDYSIRVETPGFWNIFLSKRKIAKILQKNKVKNYFITRFFTTISRYSDKKYERVRSRYIHINGVTFEQAVKIAEEICATFKRNDVLVRNNSIGRRMWYVNSNKEDN